MKNKFEKIVCGNETYGHKHSVKLVKWLRTTAVI